MHAASWPRRGDVHRTPIFPDECQCSHSFWQSSKVWTPLGFSFCNELGYFEATLGHPACPTAWFGLQFFGGCQPDLPGGRADSRPLRNGVADVSICSELINAGRPADELPGSWAIATKHVSDPQTRQCALAESMKVFPVQLYKTSTCQC